LPKPKVEEEVNRLLTEEVAAEIRQALLDWYERNKRDLPWRKEKNPYKTWVSEIMLQQTRVDTVIPYFERFMEQFPTLEALAEAPEEQVIKAWEGLGYYSRARNLHSAVKEVAAHYGGKVPDDLEAISKLKGVGPYTAGAILSIAYDKKVPAVDGNVMRVFSRLFALTDDIAKVSTRKKMERLAEKLIPNEAPGDFNQALMELGALICSPTSPQCLFCPVQSVCDAYRLGIEEELPRKKKAKPPKEVDVAVVFISCGQHFLIEKRPDHGLLAGLWGLPTIEWLNQKEMKSILDFCDKKQIPATNFIIKGQFEHIFSHRHWKVTLVEVETPDLRWKVPENWQWVTKEQIGEKTLANIYHKALKLLNK
jgi:A/G-specific adenine glycosylase